MSDGPCVIVKAGSAGGSVTLLGRSMPGGEWRFARTTVDHTEELLSDKDLERVLQAARHPRPAGVKEW